jgi:hypothetical protein
MHMPLEDEFHLAMVHIYELARDDARYNATRFLQMLTEHRGLETARILLGDPTESNSYRALWERGRLDLTVEALVLQKPWNQLFTEQELETARSRIQQYGYTPQ